MEIQGNLTKGQLKKLAEILRTDTVLEVYETKGGYMAVKVQRRSEQYPIGIDYFGPRGGIRSSELYRPDGTRAYKKDYY